jgi:hypothetical protein
VESQLLSSSHSICVYTDSKYALRFINGVTIPRENIGIANLLTHLWFVRFRSEEHQPEYLSGDRSQWECWERACRFAGQSCGSFVEQRAVADQTLLDPDAGRKGLYEETRCFEGPTSYYPDKRAL